MPAHDARSPRWLLHFVDSEPLAVTFEPAAALTQVLTCYPGAAGAEPLAEPVPTELPDDVAGRIDECIALDLCSDDERELLAAMHATDADATCELVEAMRVRIGRCDECRHFSRPGLSDDYCARRADLPHAH